MHGDNLESNVHVRALQDLVKEIGPISLSLEQGRQGRPRPSHFRHQFFGGVTKYCTGLMDWTRVLHPLYIENFLLVKYFPVEFFLVLHVYSSHSPLDELNSLY